MNAITLFHGSQNIITKPIYGSGNKGNDYGLGFYTTRNKGLAGEWAVLYYERDGYINEYAAETEDLKILKLESEPMEKWVALLASNREMRLTPIASRYRDLFVEKFLIDISDYDIITGWRADDAYFTFIEDFLSGGISIEILQRAMRLGDLGVQYCIKSERAFSRISYVCNYPATLTRFYQSAKKRDDTAKSGYKKLIKSYDFGGATITGLLGV